MGWTGLAQTNFSSCARPRVAHNNITTLHGAWNVPLDETTTMTAVRTTLCYTTRRHEDMNNARTWTK